MGSPGQTGAYTQIDLSAGFVGPLYYYSDASAGMGYNDLPQWHLIFRQTNPYRWSSTVSPATNSLNENDPSNDNYSIINTMHLTTNYKNGDHYHFKYIDKTNNQTVEWKQTSNFVDTSENITGYELIGTINAVDNPVPNGFAGIAGSSTTRTYYDGNPGSNDWFYAIAQIDDKFDIPTFSSTWSTQIELWAYAPLPSAIP